MNIEYIDFDVEVEQGAGGDYPVTVRSLSGEARGIMRLPFGQLELENHLLRLQNALLRSGGERRQQPLPDQADVRVFGQALFDALLAGDIRGRFEVSQEQARRHEHTGLRIRLHIQAPDLAALPWEYLYSRDRAEYVCLSRYSPVVRYLNLPQPPEPLTVKPPLRILGLIANPSDLKDLNTKVERQRLETALDDLRNAGLAELQWLPGQTWRDLQRALREGPWHVLHYIGHGGFERNLDEGNIFLADDQGRARPLGATELARLLSNHRYLRLAVLNSCEGAKGSNLDVFSSTASILVRGGIPAVVAMQYEITDDAAIELSRTFYESLAGGWPVDASLAEARVAISVAVPNTVEWGTPVLYMRAPDGVLFKLSLGTGQGGSMAEMGTTVLPLAQPAVAEAAVPLTGQQAVLESQRMVSSQNTATRMPIPEKPEAVGTKSPASPSGEAVVIAIPSQSQVPGQSVADRWVLAGRVCLVLTIISAALFFVWVDLTLMLANALGLVSSVAVLMAGIKGAEPQKLWPISLTLSIPVLPFIAGQALSVSFITSVGLWMFGLGLAWAGVAISIRVRVPGQSVANRWVLIGWSFTVLTTIGIVLAAMSIVFIFIDVVLPYALASSIAVLVASVKGAKPQKLWPIPLILSLSFIAIASWTPEGNFSMDRIVLLNSWVLSLGLAWSGFVSALRWNI